MEPESHIAVLVTFLVFVFLSIFVSGGEAALLSLSENDLTELQKGQSKRALRFRRLFSNPQILTIAIGSASLAIHVIQVSAAFYLASHYLPGLHSGFVFFIVLVAMAMLFFATNELWAKMFVLKHNRVFAEAVSLPMFIYFQIARPLANLMARIVGHFTSREVAEKVSHLEHKKMMSLVAHGEALRDLPASERAMINSIATFRETEVHEIMVPRTDMVCLEENASLEELTKLIEEKGHTRIPLYSNDIDNILGIFHAKDLLPYVVTENTNKIDLKTLARPAYFVPETKRVHLQLKEFQREKYHMAIVIDEYGGTAGLVTLEDVLEEIVGEIQDEYDEEVPLYRKIDNDTYVVDPKIDLHELNSKLGLDLPTEGDYDSLGGLILSLTGYVPEEKEVVTADGCAFTVEKIERNRIVQVRLQKIEPQQEAKEDQE